jgi:NAD(P)-dependent dehydrogenase (short-subunit alcohol dehydrogenase family)
MAGPESMTERLTLPQIRMLKRATRNEGGSGMRILVIGAEGDIGRVVCAELSARHEIIKAGRTRGDIQVNMADRTSVDAMYAKCGTVDAVISTAGDVHFGPLGEYTEETFMLGLRHKVMGQVNLVLGGLATVSEGGSFTLTSGVLDRDPIRMGTGAATANGALAGFALGAAIEMPRGLRINVVSPGLLDVSVPRYGAWFPGHEPVSSKRVGLAYAKSVEGALTGQVIIVE